MTSPLSLNLPVATPADAVPGSPDAAAPTDAFAALLAAMTGLVPVPVQPHAPVAPGAVPAAAVPGADAPVPGLAAATTPAVPAAGGVAAPPALAPIPLPPTVPTAPAKPTGTPAVVPAPTGEPPTAGHRPVHLLPPERHAGPAPTGAPVAWQPLAAQPPVVRREAALHAQVEATAPAQQVVGAAPAAPTAPLAPTAPAEGVGPTRHVAPAVVEAAGRLRHEGGGRTSLVVRLDPPELGAVVVRLTVQEGRVDVQLRTPDLAARSDLQAQSYDVQQVLRDNGLDLTSFDVSHGDLLQDSRGETATPDRGTRRHPAGTDGGPGTTRVTDDVTDPQPAGTWL